MILTSLEKEERLQTAIDSIREQFGFTSLLRANALEEASRSLARSKLIGGTFCWRIRWITMIDRSYLPFQSARDYQDPGMQKWMGFYLSEHTSSLSEEKNRVDFSTDLTPVEKLHLLSQLYVGQLKGSFVVKEKKQKTTIIGEVSELSPQTLSIRTNEGYRLIEVADILEIRLWEEGVYD